MTVPIRGGSLVGIVLFSLGVFFFAVNDALGKWLVVDFGVSQILLLRSIGAGLVLAPVVWRTRSPLVPPGQIGLHLLRVGCMTADTYAFYLATRFLPLADVMTFYLASPLFITALSALILRERVEVFRWCAVLAGFIGVVLAMRPSGATISPAAVIALFGSFMFASAIVTTRKLRDTPWPTLVSWQFLASGVVGGATAGLSWTPLGASGMLLMFVLGIVAMGCFICITRALSMAAASVLAPFQYASIVWAMILGWLVFGDVPSLSIVLGSAIIVASGLAIVYRERRAGGVPPEALEPIP